MATRVERVVLELDDNLTTGMAKAAAATALLKRELGGLDGQNVGATRSTKALGDEVERTGSRSTKANAELNSYAGRIKLISQLAASLGPALIPIGAVGIPAVAGLATELVGVAAAAGTAVIAFHGVGQAVGALNKAQLDPTVTNLNAAQLALEKLPPAARDFARELSALDPTLDRLRQAAASGLFPGLEDALNALRTRSDEVQKILFRIGTEVGDLSRRAGESLAGPEWDRFFKFIARELPTALAGLGRAVGSVAHGAAQLFMAFAPLNHDFTGFIIEAANGFDRWASGLAKTQGFHDFIDYLRTNGPLVADAVVAIGNAILKIVEAAAPLGGPILQALTAVANAIATIAGSPAGPTILATVTALSALARAQAAWGRISAASWVTSIRNAETFGAKVNAVRGPAIRGGLALAGIGIAASGVADKFGLANTAMGAMTGSIAGPWGAAAGAGVGLLLDLSSNAHKYDLNSQDLTATLDRQTGAITNNTAKWVAQELEQKGLLERAQEYGLSVRQITGYVLGQGKATDEVTAALGRFHSEQASGAAGARGNYIPVQEQQARAAQEFGNALDHARDSAEGSIGSFRRQQQAASAVAGSFGSAKTAAERFRLEIDRVNDTLQHRASLRDYQAALDDFTKSVKENGHTLDITTEKGRNNQAALDAIAQSALAVAQTLKGSERTRFLAQARQDFVQATQDLLGGKKAAEDLATRLGLLNNVHAKPKIDLEYNEAVGGIRRVQDAMNRLHDKTIHINAISNVHTGGTQLGYASGGTVAGPRSPYGDKVLTMLAPGEEVISNRHGQADQHRALLKAINARRYADGGTVASSRSQSWMSSHTSNHYGGSTEIDYGRLAAAMSGARPLYGDVHIKGDPTTFRREMDQDRRRQSLGAARV